MRVVANMVRGKRSTRRWDPRLKREEGRLVIRKLLISAVANAEQNEQGRRRQLLVTKVLRSTTARS